MTKSVSAIITSYNNVDYIEESVGSVFNQTHKPKEVIVIDGGSTDGTIDKLVAIKEYTKYLSLTHSRFLYEVHDGFFAASARNRGIHISVGDYIYILDGDDVACPDAIETLIEKFPDNDLVYGDFEIVSNKGEHIADHIAGKYRPLFLASQCYIHIGACIIKKQVFDTVGYFDETLHIAEDTDFLCRLALANCKVDYINKIIMKHRRHSQSVIGRGRFKADNRIVSDRYYDLFKKRFK